MNDEERQKLCFALRNIENDRFPGRTAKEAADEIERLAALAQSDATLIELEGKVHFWQGEAEKWMKTVQSIDRAPRPDASAGLIQRVNILARQLRDQAKANRAYGDVEEFYRIADKEEYAAAILEALAETAPTASAGLIEAAEIAETIANSDEVEPWVERAVLRSFANFLRANQQERKMSIKRELGEPL